MIYFIKRGTIIECIPAPSPEIIRPSKNKYKLGIVYNMLPHIIKISSIIITDLRLYFNKNEQHKAPIKAPINTELVNNPSIRLYHYGLISNRIINVAKASFIEFI